MEVIRKQAFIGMNETLQTVRKMQEKFPDQVQFVDALSWKGILHNLCHNHNFLNGEYFFFD